jgi:hypothetical protein
LYVLYFVQPGWHLCKQRASLATSKADMMHGLKLYINKAFSPT